MERVIGSDLRGVLTIPYLDDVICFSKTFDEHLEHLKIIFKHLRESGKYSFLSKTFDEHLEHLKIIFKHLRESESKYCFLGELFQNKVTL